MDSLKELLAAFGPSAVSDTELLGMVVGVPIGREILDVIGTPRGIVTRRLSELVSIPGMTPARAERLVAAVELGMRAQTVVDLGHPLSTAVDVAARCHRLKSESIEQFLAIGVNSRNRVLGEWVVARGWESGVNLTPRQVFSLLVKESVSRVVMVHNHPSGDPTPSPEDIRFTQRLIEAARTLDIRILDHVIVASGGYVSIRETARGDVEFG